MPRYESSLARDHRHSLLTVTDYVIERDHGGTFLTAKAGEEPHTHSVGLSPRDLREVLDGGHVVVITSQEQGHTHTFTIAAPGLVRRGEIERGRRPARRDNPRGGSGMGELEEIHRRAAAEEQIEKAKKEYRATHPFSLLGRLHEDAMEGLNYVDELDVTESGLDAVGLAFAVRTFRAQPYAHRYSIHDASNGRDEDWVYDDDTETWVREGETRAEREAASSDPENRIRKDNPGLAYAPTERWRADGAEDGLFNSDDALETAIAAWEAPIHGRFEPGPRPEDRKALVDQLVADARRDVDVDAVPSEYQEIYRKAFGEGFRERLLAWIARWEKTVADENRRPNPTEARYLTFPVAGAAYVRNRKSESTLTHSLDTAENVVLCRKIKIENILDDMALGAPETDAPTCAACLARDPRFKT